MRERWNNANNTKSVLSNKLNHQHSILSDIQSSIDALAQDISEIKQDIKVSDKMSDERLVDSLKTMNQLKVNDKQLNKLLLENIELNQNLINFYEHAQDVTKDSFDEFNKISLFNDLKGWISQYESKKEKKSQLQNQLTLLSKELKQLESRLDENKTTINELFKYIEVQNEEQYYQHYEAYQRYQQQLSRFNDLSTYLSNHEFSYEDSSVLSEKTTAQLEEEDDDYNDKYLEKQTEVSELSARINQMETDKTLSQLRHQYYNLKNRMNDIAKDWASLSYLETLINEHIKQIKDKRLPYVINEAINIFKTLTDGKYNLITYENDSIKVKHRNGQMYHPLELSQSTKELLYISLRLSLIKVLKPYYPFPNKENQ